MDQIWSSTVIIIQTLIVMFQPLYQRVLAQREKQKAEIMCYITTAASLILAIPPVLIGAIAKSTGR